MKGRKSPAAPGPGAAKESAALAVLVALLFMALALPVKLLVRDFPHTEADEKVYWQLAENLAKTGRYDLRGTEVQKTVSPYIYDRPLFHHPPLFPLLLVPFVFAGAQDAAILVPWLGHFLAIAAIALLGRTVLEARGLGVAPGSPLYWLPLLAVALDPVLTFVSRRLWMDSLLAGFAALAVALAAEGARRRKGALLFTSGAALGLAALTKLVALTVLPVPALLILAAYPEPRERRRAVLLFGAPLALLVVPWLVIFWRHFGTLYPSWIKPDTWQLDHYPFTRATVERPALYYVKELALAQPLLVLGLALAARRWRRSTGPWLSASLLWLAPPLAVLSLLSATGTGFQMRYLAPMLPAIYMLLYALFEQEDAGAPVVPLVAALAVLAGIGGAVNLVTLVSDDFISLFEMGGRLFR